MKKTFNITVLMLYGLLIYSHSTIDSVLVTLQSNTPDTNKINYVIKYVDRNYYSDSHRSDSLLNLIYPLILKSDGYNYNKYLHYKLVTNNELGRPDSAASYGLKYIDILNEGNDTSNLIRAYSNMGIANEMMGNYPEALNLYAKGAELALSARDTFVNAILSNNIGLVHEAQGNLVIASRYFNSALTGFVIKNHERGQSAVLNNLGKTAHTNNDYDTAEQYYRKGIKIDRRIENKRGLSTKFENLGVLFLEIQKLDSALHYVQNSVKLKKELIDNRGLGISESNLAKIYNLQGNYDEAILNARKSLVKASESTDPKTVTFSLIEWSKSLYQLGKVKQAEIKALEALKSISESNEIQATHDAHKQLYAVYKNINSQKALYHYEKSQELKDSLINRENIKKLTAIRLESEFNKTELVNKQQIALLNAENKSQHNALKASRNRNYGLLGGLGLISLFSLFLYRQREKIKSQNHIISKALDEKDVLLREIHHRVKNNLQFISSLLNLQSRHIEDKTALSALKEGQNRVKSMALIHQNLYQEDNLTGVEVKAYFEKLIDNLFNSYNISPERIRLDLDIQELNLDVDTVIPLGLVVNELVSNSLKHAFPEPNSGTISISLKELNEQLFLSVDDDGIGFIEELEDLKNKSFGYKMVHAFADQLEAELTIKSKDGTSVNLYIADYMKAD